MSETEKQEPTLAEVEATIALYDRAHQAWSDAWDRARDADQRAGRPYNRHVYWEKAHIAYVKELGVCKRQECIAHHRGTA